MGEPSVGATCPCGSYLSLWELLVLVGAASAAIPRQRARYWQAPIAAEAAPTRAPTRTLTKALTRAPTRLLVASGALDHPTPHRPEEPAGVTLGAGSAGEAS